MNRVSKPFKRSNLQFLHKETSLEWVTSKTNKKTSLSKTYTDRWWHVCICFCIKLHSIASNHILNVITENFFLYGELSGTLILLFHAIINYLDVFEVYLLLWRVYKREFIFCQILPSQIDQEPDKKHRHQEV